MKDALEEIYALDIGLMINTILYHLFSEKCMYTPKVYDLAEVILDSTSLFRTVLTRSSCARLDGLALKVI